MTRFISIDPGKSKCGLVVADSKDKKISFASVIKSELLIKNVKELTLGYTKYKVIIGNGTTSKEHIPIWGIETPANFVSGGRCLQG